MITRKILILLVAIIGGFASAYSFKVDGLYYYTNSDGKSVKVTYEFTNSSPRYSSLSGALTIPPSVTYNGTTYSVTSIGDRAFEGCSGLTSVTIPNSVTSIGEYAFRDCSGLTSVTIGNSVKVIGNQAFSLNTSAKATIYWNATSCTDFLSSGSPRFDASFKNVVIGDNVKTIPAYAFVNCKKIESVTIGRSVTSFGTQAFSFSNSLKAVIWNAENLSSTIFSGLSSITSFAFGNQVKTIPSQLCKDLTGLTSVTIPNSVKSIGEYAFSGCTGLTSVTIPSSVTSIGNYAFYGCRGLIEVFCNAEIPPTVSANTFGETSLGDINLHVPASSLPAYLEDPIWGEFSYGHIPSGSTQGNGGFSGSGSGTEADPYLIFNPVQLYNVRNFTGLEGVVFRLMADINLTAFLADNNPTQGWEPIGVQDSPFRGVFHGDNHTISGLFVNRQSSDFNGLFGFVENATIENLNIVTTTGIAGNDYNGGLCGVAQQSTLQGISVTADITGATNCGGFVGYSYDCTINDCTHTGNLSATSNYAGGFAGFMYLGNTLSCIHSGNVTGTGDYVGGFAGCSHSSTISDIEVTAASIVGQSYTGGFVGSYSGSTFQTINVSANEVEGTSYVGGFIGSTANSVASSCKAEATVTATEKAGGFIGSCAGISATDCYSIGDVTATASSASPYAGGFIGKATDGTLLRCGSIGDVTATAFEGHSYVGGLVGFFSNDTITSSDVSNCFAVGDITAGGSRVGGIIGNGENVGIANSYFSGRIVGKSDIGGIIGYGSGSAVSKVYANGSLSGTQYVGGIAGNLASSSTVKSSVAAQDVINTSVSDVGRIYGGKDSSSSVGTQGTVDGNRGMTTMAIFEGSSTVEAVDGDQHGTSLGKGLMKYKSSYQGLSWDFSSDWTILETESFPYKPSQSAPPVISGSLVVGDTVISGQCESGTSVYVRVGADVYEAAVSGNTWTATVPALQSGATVKAYTSMTGKIQSYYVSTIVGFAGDGTEASPYLIYTASDLANINSHSYYKIMNDIDLTDWIEANSPTKGWLPIGTAAGSMAQLDGDGHTVSGLWTNASDANTGLIAGLVDATVKDLTVTVAQGKSVKSTVDYVGIIAGKSTNSTLQNVEVSGNVEGANYVGGLVGNSTGGSYSHCKASDVAVTASGNYAGGLVGYTSATIEVCSATAQMSASDYIGGIAGYSTAAISQTASDGEVVATDLTASRAGGIVGYSTGDISDCYSSAYTCGGAYAGGIAGYSLGSIDNCYSSGNLYATYVGGGITGYMDGADAAVNNCFAINTRIDVSDQNGVAMRVIGGFKNGAATPQPNNHALSTMVVSVNNVTQTIYDDVLEGLSLSESALKQQATYTAQGWDFDDVWGIDEGEGHPYLLALLEEPEQPTYMVGDVNGDNKINVSDYVVTASYILEQDPQPFNFAAADVDENGKVNVNDLVGVAALALTFEGTVTTSVAPISPIITQGIDITAGVADFNGDRVVTVELSNDISISALQMDITLPEGVTLAGATLSRRATRSHTIETSSLSDGSIRLLAVSNTCKAFKETDGAILTLTLSGDAAGQITLGNIQLATPTAKGLEHSDIVLELGASGVGKIDATAGKARIFSEGHNIVVETSDAMPIVISLPNGMSVRHNAEKGRNVFPSPASGVVIVKAGNTTAKLLF